MYLELDIRHICTENQYAEEAYGDWYSSYDFFLGNTGRIVPEKQYKAEPIPDGVKTGDVVYVLYAVWSSGDSFGNSHCGSYDIIGIYKDVEIAKQNEARLKATQIWGDVNLLSEVSETGRQYYVGWRGHFEHLNTLDIQPIKVV